MNPVYEKVVLCYKQIRAKVGFVPKVAIVLGSGLGALADVIQVVDTVDYGDITGFPVSTVDGHKGRFVFGYIQETPVVIMQGRVHFYEGYEVSDVVLPIRVMKLLGADILFLTNSAGGLNTMYRPGDFMMITDHIGSFMPSPLMGENIDEWGRRFPSMENIYDVQLCEFIRQAARECNVPLREGVYVQMKGPQYETSAEVKMCQILGGDAVGMSTAIEAVAGRHMGMRVCGLSCISNMACGISKTPLNHMEVTEVGEKMAPLFRLLVYKAISKMTEDMVDKQKAEAPQQPTESSVIIDDM
ncbi:MAG: purine-nucleoside phosphorylase [Roseburia sp.]|nr:purine-nucleoside phosphorylase [Roseburia sp.]